MNREQLANEDLIGNGSIFNSVGKDELARFPIIKPDDALVERFDCVVKPLSEELGLLYQTVESLRSVRDKLLPRLISGKLKVDHLDIRLPPSMREEAESAST